MMQRCYIQRGDSQFKHAAMPLVSQGKNENYHKFLGQRFLALL